MNKVTLQDAISELLPACSSTPERPECARIVLIFTPRSGSSWIGDLLARTGIFGKPYEYGNRFLIQQFGVSARTEYEYFCGIEQAYRGENNVFSIEISWGDIENVSTLNFFDLYRDAIFFHLRRRDLIDQAISAMMATETGIFHRVGNTDILGPSGSKEVDLTSDEISRLLKKWSAHISYYEWMTEYHLLNNKISAIPLYYEDILEDPVGSIRGIVRAAGLPDNFPPSISDHQKLSVPGTAEIKKAFLREEADFVSRITQMRPPLR